MWSVIDTRTGKQLFKTHSTEWAAYIEAFEQGYMVRCVGQTMLADGYEVREVEDENT